jgi:hypothetical protein
VRAAGLAGSYGLYTFAAVISLIFVWIAVRETKGKTLEEISFRHDIPYYTPAKTGSQNRPPGAAPGQKLWSIPGMKARCQHFGELWELSGALREEWRHVLNHRD